MPRTSTRELLRDAPLTAEALRRSDRGRPMHGLSMLVLGVGVALTLTLAVAARTAHQGNEDRLLRERTRQAAAVLTAALPGIQIPLASAAEVAQQGDGGQEAFRRLMEPLVESGRPFVSASLWRVDTDPFVPILVIGAEPRLAAQPPDAIRAFLERSVATDGLSVLGLLDGDQPRLGYSYTAATGPVTTVAYAEAALPAERTSVVPADSAFAGLHNAVYLGQAAAPEALLTASTSNLPLAGRHASEVVPFGDTHLLLVMSPTTELGGALLSVLPWLVAAVGGLTAIGATMLVERLQRGRRHADELAAQNRALYDGQLSLTSTLQQSLLPQSLPTVPGMEVSARYVPGVAGLDIGGDWYDVIDIGEGRLMLVVGDVSGRGLEAGTLMASLRYASRAFASRQDDPATLLRGLTRLVDLAADRHFATVLVAVVDIAERIITIANAGHPAPLLIDADGACFLGTEVGPPIGIVRDAHYATVTHQVASGSTMVLFTDGVFERRGESVDIGLERLRRAAARRVLELDDAIDQLVAEQITAESHDDSAIVGVRWTATLTTA